MIFIVLNDKTGKPFILNVAHVETFIPLKQGGTVVHLHSGRVIDAVEDIETVQSNLKMVLTQIGIPGESALE